MGLLGGMPILLLRVPFVILERIFHLVTTHFYSVVGLRWKWGYGEILGGQLGEGGGFEGSFSQIVCAIFETLFMHFSFHGHSGVPV